MISINVDFVESKAVTIVKDEYAVIYLRFQGAVVHYAPISIRRATCLGVTHIEGTVTIPNFMGTVDEFRIKTNDGVEHLMSSPQRTFIGDGDDLTVTCG